MIYDPGMIYHGFAPPVKALSHGTKFRTFEFRTFLISSTCSLRRLDTMISWRETVAVSIVVERSAKIAVIPIENIVIPTISSMSVNPECECLSE